LLLPSSVCFAGIEEVSKAELELTLTNQSKLTDQEIEHLNQRGFRDRRPDEKNPVPVTALVRPADYQNELHRGTVPHRPDWKNYAFQTVKIPDGTTLVEQNFTQTVPLTDAFDRSPGFGHDLIFKDCNLVNVKTHPDWVIDGGTNVNQVDLIGKVTADGSIEITDAVIVDDPADVNRIKASGALE
jgi:hypothetical protein